MKLFPRRIGSLFVLAFLSFVFLSSLVQAAIVLDGNVEPNSPSEWNQDVTVYVGKTADGSVTADGRSEVTVENLYIGNADNASGIVTISGSNAEWTVSTVMLGVLGEGILNITDGGTLNSYNGFLFSKLNATVNVSGKGSRWQNANNIQLGVYQFSLEGGEYLGGKHVINIFNGGLVQVDSLLRFEKGSDNGNNVINMATGGMLALKSDKNGMLEEFIELTACGTNAICWWDAEIDDWALITTATEGVDYTIEYRTEGDLAGYTILTVGCVPEPNMVLLLGSALGFVFFCFPRRRAG